MDLVKRDDSSREEVICLGCQNVDTKGIREPVLLPGCGHTFCRRCLYRIERSGCPICKTPDISSIKPLPIVSNLLNLLKNYTKSDAIESPPPKSLSSTSSLPPRSSHGSQHQHSHPERNNMDDMSVSPSERIYVNNTSPRGLVLILNYKFESDPENHRKGTDADAETLHRVFQRMDYETEEHCDLSYPGTRRILDEFRSRDRLREVSCVVVVVLSHGLNRDTFTTADGEHMKMKALRRHFTDEKCPHMSDKPKIFLLQFCRGSDIASQVNRLPSTDDIREASTDMMCLYAAQEGFVSYRFEGKSRDPFAGTPFIKSFCQVLETKGNLWLDDLLREFIDNYSNTQWGQPLECQNLAFKKKFCFNPS